MNYKKFLKVGILLLMGIFLVGSVVPALAGDTAPGVQAGNGNGNGNGNGVRAQNILGALADATGLSTDDIRAKKQEGKTFLDIAEDAGISADQLTTRVMENNQTRLQERLEAGTITQDQYDQCLEQMQEKIQERLENNGAGSCGNGTMGGNGNSQANGNSQRAGAGNANRGSGNCGVCPNL